METLKVILTKIEIFVFVNFLFSLVNGDGYFKDAISLLWFVREKRNKKPYVPPVLTP
jgi:hypothetical protein